MKIKKLPKKLNEGEMAEFIIDRGKSDQEIETQIGRLAEKFQGLEQDQGALSGENEFREIEDLGVPPQECDDSAQVEIPPIINHPKKKRRKKAESLEGGKLIRAVNILLRIC